jgi:hypothetical protein
MNKPVGRAVISLCVAAGLLSQTHASPQSEPERQGFLVGKVYELDVEKYEAYLDELRRENKDLNDPRNFTDWDDYLEERSEVQVTARQVEANLVFPSQDTNGTGDYVIRKTPTGTYQFTLTHDGVDHPVEGWLDLTVDLAYLAEVCFALDRDRGVAWMIRPDRANENVPPWLPFECRSVLRACLAPLTTTDGKLPRGLLVLAGGSATAAALGLLGATDQVEASPPQEP